MKNNLFVATILSEAALGVGAAAFGAGAPSLALSDAAFFVAFGALSSFPRSRFFCMVALMGKALKGIVVSE
jgi:hypothetical protein